MPTVHQTLIEDTPASPPPAPRATSKGIAFEHASYTEPFASVDEAVELYTTTFGPIVMLGGERLAGPLRALFERHAVAAGLEYGYLVTLSPRAAGAAPRA